ncbi:hypothetical protein C5B85_10860 [Pseudoclavibacter sp. AY1F1]|uniref:GIY-YIG nuclease family protein n=1 Tax=Pseudoclavibacter sp. AY1F1 TaxID=2080583 RepID=UPI000CE73851|nr:hypothetical protein [Pseudoclavibacter sp. AY1F1]PPF44138.1 hypothetical protein C5B85_10860 [Pseudoclavibacter sp. AY1F1]
MATATVGGMDAAADALRALSGSTWPVAEAAAHVPASPGLYAIYGDERAWRDLGLEAKVSRALYVGKSEDSLRTRELGDHFAALPGRSTRTGSSTVRRSFAALLREPLNLRAVPRNPDKPERPANYGLADDGDERLTEWMHQHLSIAVWAKPVALSLAEQEGFETAIIRAWTPPLNLRRNPCPHPRLKAARAAMADEVRAWMAARTVSPRSKPALAAPAPEPPRTPQTGRPTPTTPAQLADELDIDEKRLRARLRLHYEGPGKGGRWSLTPEQVNHMRRLFR